jgi:hypothetical protein
MPYQGDIRLTAFGAVIAMARVSREAKSGRFVVRGEKPPAGGGESWKIVPEDRAGKTMVVSTSASSVRSLDRITEKHAKALKRLAGK